MIKIESNRIARNMNRYTPIVIIESFLCPSGKRSCIFSKFNLLNVDTPLIWTFFKTPSVSKFIGFNCSNDLLFFNAQPSDYVQMQLRFNTHYNMSTFLRELRGSFCLWKTREPEVFFPYQIINNLELAKRVFKILNC